MRTIKFRAWTQTGKKMSEPFVLGNYKSSKLYLNTLDRGNKERKKLIWLEWTGLKDKNGKEIYEGDIVTDIYGHVLQVIFEGGGFKATMEGLEIEDSELQGIWKDDMAEDFEVIGNIYENPELLK